MKEWRDIENWVGRHNIDIIGTLKDDRGKEREVLKKIMTEQFPVLTKDIISQLSKPWVQNRIKKKKLTFCRKTEEH